MKRKLILGIAIVLILGSGGFLFLQARPKAVAIEDVLPAKPVVYLHVQDLAGKMDRSSQTAFWKGLAAFDYRPILLAAGIDNESVTTWQKVAAQLLSPDVQGLVKKFLGKDFLVAIYPTPIDDLNTKALLDVASNIIFVTRLPADVQFADFFAGIFSQQQKNISTQTVAYKGHKITLITTSDGIRVGYVRFSDIFVLGLGDHAAKTAIDILTNKKSVSLNKDAEYLQARASFLKEADTQGYLDLRAVTSAIKSQMLKFAAQDSKRAELIKKQVETNFEYLQAFTRVGFSAVTQGPLAFKADVHFNKKQLNPDIRPFYECSPQENKTFSFIPQTSIGYQWTGCYDFKFYWEQAKKDAQATYAVNPQGPKPEEMLADFEKQLGLSIEQDIVSVLGREVGGFLTDVDTKGSFPVPQMAIFLSISDQVKAQKIIDAILAKQPVSPLQTESYKDQNIRYASIPLLAGIEPGYTFLGQYFVLGSNRQTLKDAIDVFKNSAPAITAKEGFQKIDPGLLGKNNAIFYIQFDELMKKVGALVDWTDKWAASQTEKQKTFKSGFEQKLTELNAQVAKNEKEQASLAVQLADVNAAIKKQVDVPAAPVTPSAPSEAAPASTAAATSQQIQSEVNYIEKRKAIEGKISALGQDIQASKDNIEKMQQVLKKYDEESARVEERKIFVEHLVRPTLSVLSSIKSFATRFSIGEGILESYFYLKIE